jgi:hypothetical protein
MRARSASVGSELPGGGMVRKVTVRAWMRGGRYEVLSAANRVRPALKR